MSYEEQYLEGFRKILREGKWVYNERTNTRCLTLPRYVYEIALKPDTCPLLSVRPSYPVSAVAEPVGYLRRYDNAQQFEDIGTKSWWVNSEQTSAWNGNLLRKGKGDLGKVYGAALDKRHIVEVLYNIQNNNDNRGLVLNWWHPDMFDKGCLRPCMFMHDFSLLDGKVHLTSVSRSKDAACGWNFNSIQIYFLGMLAAKLSGNEGGTALHVCDKMHVYEQHSNGVEEMLSRKPVKFKTNFKINGWVESYQDITEVDCHAREYFTLEGYKGVAQSKIDFELIA
jgi:thymidylate synthase